LIVASGKAFLVIINIKSPIFGYLLKASMGVYISLALGNLTHLSHLNLSHNSLSGPFPMGLLSSLIQLKVLDLSYNHLFGDIGDISGSLASIQIFNMSSNRLYGTIQSSFLQQAWNLTELNVSNNSLTSPIPSSSCVNSTTVKLLDFSFINIMAIFLVDYRHVPS
jgi:hypothetical protein